MVLLLPNFKGVQCLQTSCECSLAVFLNFSQITVREMEHEDLAKG